MAPVIKSIARSIAKTFGVNAYEWRYARAAVQKYVPASTKTDVDVVYVTPISTEPSWILNTFCHELARNETATFECVPLDCEVLPKAKIYFHSHFFVYRTLLFRYPEIARCKNVVLFTHPQDEAIRAGELKRLLNSCSSVASMCSQFRDMLVDVGVEESRISVVLAGADPNRFLPHQRANRPVGMCSGYRERKNPELMAEIVRAAPHREFILIGRHWDQWEGFKELCNLSNFEYCPEVPYEDMPKFYSSIDVLLSPSTLEGGPMPVLEAMMCNVVPVASRIGFSPDLIDHGKNGFLFDMTSTPKSVVEMIDQAYTMDNDIRDTVKHLTWEHYHDTVSSLFAA